MSKWSILESIFFIVIAIIGMLFRETRLVSTTILLVLAIISLVLKLLVLKSSAK